MTATPSPCIGYCRLDAEQAYCEGCFRSLEEITCWTRLSPERQQAVVEACRRRRAAAHPSPATEFHSAD